MTEAADTSSAPDVHEVARAGVAAQAGMIYRAIFASPVGRRLVVLLTALVIAILATTYGQIVLNRWNQPFYDAITRRDLNGFFFIKGEAARLDGVMSSTEWITHMTRAGLHLEGAGAVRGAAGDSIPQRMALWTQLIPR